MRVGIGVRSAAILAALVLALGLPSPASASAAADGVESAALEQCLRESAIFSFDQELSAGDGVDAAADAVKTLQHELLVLAPDVLSTVGRVIDAERSAVVGLEVVPIGARTDVAAIVAKAVANVEAALPAARDLDLVSTVAVVSTESAPSFNALCSAFLEVHEVIAQGAAVESFRISHGEHAVVIAVLEADALVNRIADRFPGIVRVEQSPYSQSVGASRINDTGGYNAGTAIRVGGTPCTAGFKMSNANGTFLLTAGHCNFSGSAVVNASGYGGCTYGSGASVGTYAYRQSASNIDLAVIVGSAPTTAHVWRGSACTGSVQYQVGGTASPAYGTLVNFSGHRTGETVGVVASSEPTCTTNSGAPEGGDFTACGVYRNISSNGRLCNHADSGGPVFRVINGRAYAIGTITGFFEMDTGGAFYYGCTWTDIDYARTGYSANVAAYTGPLPTATNPGSD